MRRKKLEVVLLSDDAQMAGRFAAAFKASGLTLFKAAYLPARNIITEPGFDALYWTLPAAERWNVRPIEDVIQVIPTNPEDRDEGWPAYLLVGLALSPSNAATIVTGLRTWARALLTALAKPASASITRVKVPMDMIAVERLSPDHVAYVLADAERELT